MNFKILHESKKRMRVRMAQKRMSIKEADMLQYYLEGFEFVRKAKHFGKTDNKRFPGKNGGDALVYRCKKYVLPEYYQ